MWFNNLVNAKVRIIFNIQNIWRLFLKFSLFHWLYTQNGINLFSLGQHFKNQKTHPTLIFGSKNGCNLVTTLFTPLLSERGRLTSISMEIRIFANNELLLAIKSY